MGQSWLAHPLVPACQTSCLGTFVHADVCYLAQCSMQCSSGWSSLGFFTWPRRLPSREHPLRLPFSSCHCFGTSSLSPSYALYSKLLSSVWQGGGVVAPQLRAS